MIIREVMTPVPNIVPSEDLVLNAARYMKALNVGVLPVTENKMLVGLLTDRDIVLRAVAENRDPAQLRVSDIMSRNVITCHDASDLKEAAEIMERHKVRRLIVLDEENKAIGIVSLGDLATSGDSSLAGEALSEISEPSEPNR